MKQCPTCQKEYADGMKFCQTDGTPLVNKEEKVDPFKTMVGGMPPLEKTPPPEPVDPFKTVVGGVGGQKKSDDDLLEVPEKADPNKTMVSLPDSVKASIPKSESSKSSNEPSAPENKPFEPPPLKSSDVGLNAPSFGDLSGSKPMDAPKPSEPAPFNPPPLPKNDPPPPSPFGSPFSNQGAGSGSNEPFGKASGSSPFDSPASSPFEKTPPPPYKEPETFGSQKSPEFNKSPFGEPDKPFAEKSNDPFNSPFQQNEWTPPPAPVASWQDQSVGANTPFQPPVAGTGTGGENKTLAIVSLILGILSLPCCSWYVFGIAALITGFMAKGKADSDPATYGGRGMALAGMIMGGISLLLGIIVTILYVLGAFAGAMR